VLKEQLYRKRKEINQEVTEFQTGERRRAQGKNSPSGLA
jgi:hypothetical protein